MTPYIIKLVISAVIITVVSEVAKRSAVLGGILVSLPVVSILSLIWLWRETQDTTKAAEFCWSVFWLVLPSLALFALLPVLLKRGVAFWGALAAATAAAAILYVIMVVALHRFGASVAS